MVSIRLFSFVLVFSLVLIGESTAQPQDGRSLEPARKNLAKFGKEVYDAVPAAAEVGNARLEGRKMMDKKRVTVEGSDGEESAKISGKVISALNNQIGSSQKKFKNQDDRNMLEKNFLSSASPEASWKHSVKLPSISKPVSDKGGSECLSRSPKLVPQESDNSPRKLLQAAKELMNFMNKDYSRPPSKPPVHNREPLDQEQSIP